MFSRILLKYYQVYMKKVWFQAYIELENMMVNGHLISWLVGHVGPCIASTLRLKHAYSYGICWLLYIGGCNNPMKSMKTFTLTGSSILSAIKKISPSMFEPLLVYLSLDTRNVCKTLLHNIIL